MGCPGCEQEANMVNIEEKTILTKAIAYAKEKQKTVAIYKTSDGSLDFVEYQIALTGNYPVTRFVSHLVASSPGYPD